MKIKTLTAITAAIFASGAHAQTGIISQSVDFDFDFSSDAFLAVDRFDDMGGTRQLDRVTFDWDLNYQLDYRLENTGPTAVAAADFELSYEYNSVHQLGLATDINPPFYGSGGIFFFTSADLEAEGGTFQTSFEESFQRTIEFVPGEDDFVIEPFLGDGELTTVLGGFGGLGFVWLNEPTGWDAPSGPFGQPLYPVDDAIWFFTEDSRHFGSWTVNYEFTTIPAPASATALLGLAALNRRRR